MTIRIYERSCIQEFTLGAVAADSTGGGPLDFLLGTGQNIFNGILRGVSASCDSTDFDVSIRTKSNGQPDTIDEIYKVSGINLYRSDDNLYQGWINKDSPTSSKLYMVITNNDLRSATGLVSVRIFTDIHKRFSKHTG